LLRAFLGLLRFFFLFLLVAMAGVYHWRAKSRAFPLVGTAGIGAARRWNCIAQEARLAKLGYNL